MAEVLIVAGSLREGRQSLRVAEYVREVAAKHIDAAELVDIRDYAAIGPYDGVTQTALTRAMSERFAAAAGFIFVVPEWHGGIPGHLKNMIDYMGTDQFFGKPVAIVGVSSGMGGALAVSSLRDIVGVLGASFAAPFPYVRNVKAAWNEETGELLEARIATSIDLLARELARMCAMKALV